MGKKGWKNKKIWCVVIVAALLCVGTGGYLFFHVQAQGILTGLEEKVSQKVKDSKKFQIIEVVPDGLRRRDWLSGKKSQNRSYR